MTDIKIGRYEIRDELGEGGMGTVYLAYDPTLGREVAVKVLHPHLFSHDPDFSLRFEQEARTVAALEHSNIVPVYEFGEDSNGLYIVMRLMQGGTLRDKLTQGPFSLDETAAILGRVGSALDHAHRSGIVHRDLKPGNILFDGDGNAFLGDFGIVKTEDADRLKTRTGQTLGTPHYMSPEQVDAKTLDGRSDIYALGVIFYEMVTGVQPYDHPTSTVRVMAMHLTAPIPSLLQANPDLPPALEAILQKAMAKEPADRFATVQEMVTAVKAAAVPNPIATVSEIEPLTEPTTTKIKAEAEAVPQKEAAVTTPVALAAQPQPEPSQVPKLTSPQTTTEEKRPIPRWLWGVGGLVAILLIAWGLSAALGTTATPTELVAATASATATVTPSATATVVPSVTAMPSATATATATATTTATPSNTPTPTTDPNILPIEAGLHDTWLRPQDGMTMVFVPGGSFMMGTDPDVDPNARSDESQHQIILNEFWIDQTEVTNEQFEKFVMATNYKTTAEIEGEGWTIVGSEWEIVPDANWQHPYGLQSNLDGLNNHPVVLVSWDDATAYCDWVGGQLPTEAQWEYAARGNNGNMFSWGNEFDGTQLNYCDTNCEFNRRDGTVDDGFLYTAPVGNYAGDSWAGAQDMTGNVWEWVEDWYDEDYYDVSPVVNPEGPTDGASKVLRGGSWAWHLNLMRSAYRGKDTPGPRYIDNGFRCAVSPDPNIPTVPVNSDLHDTWLRLSDEMKMVFVPGGTFMMGSDPDADSKAQAQEQPQHEVTLDEFWIDQTEVTNEQFENFVMATGYETMAEIEGEAGIAVGSEFVLVAGADWQHPNGPETNLDGLNNHPVVLVSWADASAYCDWNGAQLPTEAQWEYAARGTVGNIFPWGNEFDGTKLNYCDTNCEFNWRDETVDDGYLYTAPVGSYAGDSWVDAQDMAGNVWEWVADWYDENYYDVSPIVNPTGPADGTDKVLRGFSWGDNWPLVRSASRLNLPPDTPFTFNGGFRCVVSPGS